MPSLERVQRVRERLFRTGTVVGPDGDVRELFPIAIGPAEGIALRDWVRKEGARTTLEAGLGYGIAALCICEGLLANGPSGRHVAVDPYQFESLAGHRTRFVGTGLQILEEAGVRDLVEFYDEESQVVFPRLLSERRRFDLAFLDGNHRFEAVFLDLFFAGRLLNEGGIVFVDDTQLPGVRRAVDFWLANLGWTVEDEGEEGEFHAWMVLRTGPNEAFLRPFTEFVEF